eukprot:CAMPEP_0114151188 /NCGR_PEP_ID=MMETSP0043_2-20121206/23119_1 /TAXON_ID=464988 /ORGANISM="Hemiselmis andersenii, Strain CCMP644" /LENGTH=71 /DNA_ID=CAMNT_0001246001 /DNA_START=346 /DNA_END=557 /DNA_ORIENTATION=+
MWEAAGLVPQTESRRMKEYEVHVPRREGGGGADTVLRCPSRVGGREGGGKGVVVVLNLCGTFEEASCATGG